MKSIVKIVLVLLAALLALSCASCATKERDVPDGMKNATAADADYRLYVPSVWNVNTAYGVSGAYYSLAQQSTVSVQKYPVTAEMDAAMAELSLEGGARLDWFWEQECKATVEALALGGSVQIMEEENNLLTLGGCNAHRFHCRATVDGNNLHFVHAVTEKNGAFYVFSFIAAGDLYESLLANVESMLEQFIFAEPYVPDTYVKPIDPDAEAPEGMKLASNDDVAYRFYVPAAWEINGDVEIFAAYVKGEGKVLANVSVVPYYPDVESMSVAEFYTLCESMMKSTAGEGGFELLDTQTEVDLGGRPATSYTYRYTVGGVEYRYTQVIAAYKSMLYSVTYTALPEHFETYRTEFDRIVEEFEFR